MALLSPTCSRFGHLPVRSRYDSGLRSPSGASTTPFEPQRRCLRSRGTSSEHPTLIGNLVGISIANLAIGTLGEMLEHPGCPNLYWALTNLPTPLVPLDKGMGGERALVLSEFRGLDEHTPMNADELRSSSRTRTFCWETASAEPGASRVRAWLDRTGQGRRP